MKQESIKKDMVRSSKDVLASYDIVSQAADRVSKNLLLANAGGIAATLGVIGALISNNQTPGGALISLIFFFLGLVFAGLDAYKLYSDAKKHQNYHRLQLLTHAEKLDINVPFDKEETELDHKAHQTIGSWLSKAKVYSAIFFILGSILGIVMLAMI